MMSIPWLYISLFHLRASNDSGVYTEIHVVPLSPTYKRLKTREDYLRRLIILAALLLWRIITYDKKKGMMLESYLSENRARAKTRMI